MGALSPIPASFSLRCTYHFHRRPCHVEEVPSDNGLPPSPPAAAGGGCVHGGGGGDHNATFLPGFDPEWHERMIHQAKSEAEHVFRRTLLRASCANANTNTTGHTCTTTMNGQDVDDLLLPSSNPSLCVSPGGEEPVREPNAYAGPGSQGWQHPRHRERAPRLTMGTCSILICNRTSSAPLSLTKKHQGQVYYNPKPRIEKQQRTKYQPCTHVYTAMAAYRYALTSLIKKRSLLLTSSLEW